MFLVKYTIIVLIVNSRIKVPTTSGYMFIREINVTLLPSPFYPAYFLIQKSVPVSATTH